MLCARTWFWLNSWIFLSHNLSKWSLSPNNSNDNSHKFDIIWLKLNQSPTFPHFKQKVQCKLWNYFLYFHRTLNNIHLFFLNCHLFWKEIGKSMHRSNIRFDQMVQVSYQPWSNLGNNFPCLVCPIYGSYMIFLDYCKQLKKCFVGKKRVVRTEKL